MYKGLAKSSSAILFAFSPSEISFLFFRKNLAKALIPLLGVCFLSLLVFSNAGAEADVTYEITDIKTQLSDNTLDYTITGTSVPTYNAVEGFSPFRIKLDIAGGNFAEDLSDTIAKIPENNFTSLKVEKLTVQDLNILRFEFSIVVGHNYAITSNGNILNIRIAPGSNTISETEKTAPTSSRTLTDLKITTSPTSTTVLIASNSAIEDYTVDTVGSSDGRPPRMFIDIDNVDFNELIREKFIGTSVNKIRVAKRGNGARIVFDSGSTKLFRYTTTATANGLVVVIEENIAQTADAPLATARDISSTKADATLDALIDSSEQLVTQSPDKLAGSETDKKIASLSDDFSFSGYNKKRISVDFYKIDIHNVFRLFRQITDLNIIVDEGVSGSLTLALTDVPWDFALDIIMNLMDLKKEERFNTIVIYPQDKAFLWPTRAEDNLSFEADVEIIEQESLIIEQSAILSKEIMKAKEYMAKAQQLEEREDFEDAALLYTKALELWPENAQLSNRLATLYLVNLGMNAKAVYYARESLKRDPTNANAALYAAIASANMQRTADAKDFFSQSISSSPPMKEALISYAAFSENNGHNDAALKLIDKYHSFYSETIDTMVSKARLLDKIGSTKEATLQYKSILASGFQMRPDLKKYIQARVTAKDF